MSVASTKARSTARKAGTALAKQSRRVEGVLDSTVKRQRRNGWLMAAVCVSPLCCCLGYVKLVNWRLKQTSHRPIKSVDMYHLRGMHGRSLTLDENPGVRIERSFLSEGEMSQLLLDCRIAMNHHGYSVIPQWVKPNFNKQLAFCKARTKVNSHKATGQAPIEGLNMKQSELAEDLRKEEEEFLSKTRQFAFESNPAAPAPWLCGSKMDESKLPGSIQKLVNKIRSLDEEYRLGSLRDVTIDYRFDRYFRTDPHIFDQKDGVTLFMITLASDAVITLIPSPKVLHRRSRIMDIVKDSFTDLDVDILHRQGDLLCLTDDARMTMDSAIRQGLDYKVTDLLWLRKQQMLDRNEDEQLADPLSDEEYAEYISDDIINESHSDLQKMVGNLDALNSVSENEQYILCDWWGDHAHVLPRNRERICITLAFARPT